MGLRQFTKSFFIAGLSVCVLYIGMSGCKKQEYTLPDVTTGNVTDITQTTASCDGTVDKEGSAEVSVRGLVWNSKGLPVITTDSVSTEGKGKGSFSSDISGLTPSTLYYIRAYATNSVGTKYGSLRMFWTLGTPVIATNYATNVTSESAEISGSRVYNGGSAITEMGLCYNTAGSPDKDDNVLIYSGSDSIFYFTLTGLMPFTTYYVRAYGINENGLAFGEEKSFNTLGGYIEDADSGTYEVVQIGTQEWLSTNLRVTQFNDSTTIPLVTDSNEWGSLTTPAYCYYNNSDSCGNIYGVLYNWYAVNTGKLCPDGYHAASDDDWKTLDEYLGVDAANKLKEIGVTHWQNDSGASNESNFSALPGGYRDNKGGFIGISRDAAWWSGTANNDTYAWSWEMSDNSTGMARTSLTKNRGLSVRCVKD